MKNKVQRFESNKQGKDYIVGDLHGCLEDLLLALKAIGFNENVDRLFCVGDLIDRGRESFATANLIDKPWFHSTVGNHEWMMIETILNHNHNARETWLANGGEWHLKEDRLALKILAEELNELPYVIVVGEGEERFNIVHAELLRHHWNDEAKNPVCNGDVDYWTFSQVDEWEMLWGRGIIKDLPHYIDPEVVERVQGDLSITYVGHTPLRNLRKVAKQMYLDRGCVYHHTSKHKASEMNALAIACHQDKVVYEWNPMWKRITSVPYANISNK